MSEESLAGVRPPSQDRLWIRKPYALHLFCPLTLITMGFCKKEERREALSNKA